VTRQAAKAIALVAHDRKKAALAAFVARHRTFFAGHELHATGTTGGRILKRFPKLRLTRLKSGPLGGDQQIGALIAEGRIGALFFFVDPLSPHPHDVDVKALTRLALVYDVPMALNEATAEMVVAGLARERPAHPTRYAGAVRRNAP
jgi:methylglyoxal synthase